MRAENRGTGAELLELVTLLLVHAFQAAL
jgi:hypothetical protein